MTLDYRRGLAAHRESRRAGGVPQSGHECEGHWRADVAELKVDSAAGAVRRLQERRAGGACRRARRRRRRARHYLAATPLDAMAEQGFSSVEAQGCRCSAAWTCFSRSSSSITRRVLVHVRSGRRDVEPARLERSPRRRSPASADIDGAQVVRADIRGRVLGGPFQMTARAPRSRQPTAHPAGFSRHAERRDALRSGARRCPPSMAIGGQTDWRAVLRMAPEPARERSVAHQLEPRGPRARTARAAAQSRRRGDAGQRCECNGRPSGGARCGWHWGRCCAAP